jgi:acetylornithine deacetylase/succinyl-diaminopimelate desuccinylase-like protein
MSTGATDGLFFRQVNIPVYGTDFSWGISPDDERAHGLDERLPVRAMYNAVAGWEMLIRDLAGGGAAATPAQAPEQPSAPDQRGSAL